MLKIMQKFVAIMEVIFAIVSHPATKSSQDNWVDAGGWFKQQREGQIEHESDALTRDGNKSYYYEAPSDEEDDEDEE